MSIKQSVLPMKLNDDVTKIFGIAKELYKMSNESGADLSAEIYGVEDFAFNHFLCGTNNKNADDYLDAYKRDEISVDELIDNLTYPKECDRR